MKKYKILHKRVSVKLFWGSIVLFVCFVVLGAIFYVVIGYRNGEWQASEEFRLAQTRCHSRQIVVGWKDLYGEKMYYSFGDMRNKAHTNSEYFCSNKEAEDAGYKKSTY